MGTAKQVILNTDNPQILEIEVCGVSKKLVRTFKEKWREMIYTKRGQEV